MSSVITEQPQLLKTISEQQIQIAKLYQDNLDLTNKCKKLESEKKSE